MLAHTNKFLDTKPSWNGYEILLKELKVNGGVQNPGGVKSKSLQRVEVAVLKLKDDLEEAVAINSCRQRSLHLFGQIASIILLFGGLTVTLYLSFRG